MDPRTLRAKQEYEGKHFYTKDGKEEFVIINLNSVADVTVQFVNSGLIKHTNIGNIKMGLPNPFAHSCVILFNMNCWVMFIKPIKDIS